MSIKRYLVLSRTAYVSNTLAAAYEGKTAPESRILAEPQAEVLERRRVYTYADKKDQDGVSSYELVHTLYKNGVPLDGGREVIQYDGSRTLAAALGIQLSNWAARMNEDETRGIVEVEHNHHFNTETHLVAAPQVIETKDSPQFSRAVAAAASGQYQTARRIAYTTPNLPENDKGVLPSLQTVLDHPNYFLIEVRRYDEAGTTGRWRVATFQRKEGNPDIVSTLTEPLSYKNAMMVFTDTQEAWVGGRDDAVIEYISRFGKHPVIEPSARRYGLLVAAKSPTFVDGNGSTYHVSQRSARLPYNVAVNLGSHRPVQATIREVLATSTPFTIVEMRIYSRVGHDACAVLAVLDSKDLSVVEVSPQMSCTGAAAAFGAARMEWSQNEDMLCIPLATDEDELRAQDAGIKAVTHLVKDKAKEVREILGASHTPRLPSLPALSLSDTIVGLQTFQHRHAGHFTVHADAPGYDNLVGVSIDTNAGRVTLHFQKKD